MTVTCPICGEFEGEVSSVKAHITSRSGETDPHDGRTGGQYADLLEQRAGDGDGSEEEEVEEATDDAEGEPEEPEENMPTQAEYRQQHEQDSDTDDTTEAADGGEPVDLLADIPMVYLIGATVLILLVGYLLLDGDGSSSQPDPQPEGEQEAAEEGGEFGVFADE